MFLPLVFLTVVSRFPTGLILYWMTTNLWTVGQGLVTRRLVPKPNPAAAAIAQRTGPKRSSRTPAKDEESATPNGAAAPEQPKQAPSAPRRVKKKGRAKR
jgi:YidC/Oxa1 family membrane protein insertase